METEGISKVLTLCSLSLCLSVCVSLTPAGLVCVVKPEGVPQLCQTDEIGEFCVCSIATGTSYYGLTGMTKNTFEVRWPTVCLFICGCVCGAQTSVLTQTVHIFGCDRFSDTA